MGLAYDVLRGWGGAEAFLAWEVVPSQILRAWGVPRAVGWLAPSAFHGRRWLTVVGEAFDGAEVAQEALRTADGQSAAGVSLPVGAAELVPGLRLHTRDAWTWWWTQDAPQVAPDPRVGRLDVEADAAGLAHLVWQSRSVYLQPGDPRARAWSGLRADGQLLGCLAVEQHKAGVPHLASVVVDREVRGQGIGRALCGTVVREAFAAGAPAVTLGMMTANDAAAGLYRGLGFTAGPSFVSGRIEGRRMHPEPGWRHGGGDAA